MARFVIPLKADDPLVVVGPDGIPGNGDEVPVSAQFMMMTRGTVINHQPGPDGQLNTSDDIS